MNSGSVWQRALLLLVSACTSKTVTLGQAPLPNVTEAGPVLPTVSGADAGPRERDASTRERDAAPALFEVPIFGEPQLVLGIESDSKDDNPTLTGDLLQIYFTSTRGSNADVWMAARTDPSQPFAAPVTVDAVNTAEFDSSPAIDADGLTLWVGSQRDTGLGGLDVWMSRRAERTAQWGTPALVVELSSPEDDIPRPVGAAGTVMPLGSRRAGADTYLTYWAERARADAPFAEPRLLDELVVEGANTIDAFLSIDGTQMLYVHARDDKGDLFIAERTAGGFTTEHGLDSVNTEADERDPWLSPEGRMLFFASDRGGSLQIYQAARVN